MHMAMNINLHVDMSVHNKNPTMITGHNLNGSAKT